MPFRVDGVWNHGVFSVISMKKLILSQLVAFGLIGSLNTTHAAAPGTFTLTGSMSSGRSLQTATLLCDGRVLVCGGVDALGVTLGTAEIYDPVSGAFSLTGSMGTARFAANATLLPDGRVLIAGGEDSRHLSTASAELFDPINGTFSTTGSLLTSRLNPTMTLLGNGAVLVTGGYEGSSVDGTPLNSAELYDPASGIFSLTGSMDVARRNQTATMLTNGSVLIAGGYNGSYVNAPEIYNLGTGTFVPTGDMSVPRRYPTATLLPDGKVLVAGGYTNSTTGSTLASSELYDPGTGNFTGTGSMTTPRGRQTGTLLRDGTVLIAGGYNLVTPLASAELYDPVVGTFAATGSMNVARWRHTETLLQDGNVLIVGGADVGGNVGALASAEIYTVPEPSTYALFGIGALSLIVAYRRRKKSVTRRY